MPDIMTLTIVLRKTIPDEAAGKVLLDLVKSRFEDQPEISVSGQTTIRYDTQE